MMMQMMMMMEAEMEGDDDEYDDEDDEDDENDMMFAVGEDGAVSTGSSYQERLLSCRSVILT
jgi:hypothetical protein